MQGFLPLSGLFVPALESAQNRFIQVTTGPQLARIVRDYLLSEGVPSRGDRTQYLPLVLRLPDPMLSRPGLLPSGRAWSFELKWDGFRALVSTEDGLRVRSRRGWNMTPALPELRKLPTGLVLDGSSWRGKTACRGSLTSVVAS